MNQGPTSAFNPTAAPPGITWWYDWGAGPASGAAAGFEFVPMIWGNNNISGTKIPAGSKYLLGFNEPNFSSQANLTPTQAANLWPQVEAIAKSAGIPLVSPAVNYCGACSDPSITDPYTWLEDFFNACSGCEVDYIAVHWYNCDLPSLQGYLEGSSNFAGFAQFNKPIWLTEFACDNSNDVAAQQAYMKLAVPYLESQANIFRYSWFNSSAIPNAQLTNSNGTLTALGQTYVGLAQNCQ
jgi:hypothetical protein